MLLMMLFQYSDAADDGDADGGVDVEDDDDVAVDADIDYGDDAADVADDDVCDDDDADAVAVADVAVASADGDGDGDSDDGVDVDEDDDDDNRGFAMCDSMWSRCALDVRSRCAVTSACAASRRNATHESRHGLTARQDNILMMMFLMTLKMMMRLVALGREVWSRCAVMLGSAVL